MLIIISFGIIDFPVFFASQSLFDIVVFCEAITVNFINSVVAASINAPIIILKKFQYLFASLIVPWLFFIPISEVDCL